VFMSNIRNFTKKHRKILLAVVIMLCFGVVGSFAKGAQTQQQQGITPEILEAYDQAVTDAYAANGEADTWSYEVASSMASLLSYVYSLYYQAFGQVSATDSTTATGYYLKSLSYMEDAMEAYERTIETMPEETDNATKVNTYASYAELAFITGHNDKAAAAYETAMGIEKTTNLVLSYASYLATAENPTASVTYLTEYLNELPAESEDRAAVEGYIEYYTSYAEYLAGLESETEGEGEGETEGEGEGENAAN